MFFEKIDIGNTKPRMYIAGKEHQTSIFGIILSSLFSIFMVLYFIILFENQMINGQKDNIQNDERQNLFDTDEKREIFLNDS
jgi:hypothetical protein